MLLLDEPLSALDLQLRQAMRLELKRLHQDLGITFVFVTHDQEEAITMSNRIAVMNEGRIHQLGAPEEIYERPATRFVAGFIGETNLLDATLVSADGPKATVRLPTGVTLEVSGPDRIVAEAGTVVAIAVRPPRVAVLGEHDTVAADFVAVPGVLREMLFLGDSTRVTVEFGTGRNRSRCGTTTNSAIRSVSSGPVTGCTRRGAANQHGWWWGERWLTRRVPVGGGCSSHQD